MNQQNILLVTIDSLRSDAVYGNEANTPRIDMLTESGFAYKQAFAQGPFTTFSMPSMFTSRYPSALSYVTFSESTIGVTTEGEPTLPTILKANGYETAGFHSNPLLSNLFGFDQGFDVLDSRLPFSNTNKLPGRMKILADKLSRIIRKHPYLPAEKVNERAVTWIDKRNTDQPFFLWVHYMDVHGPYIAKSGSHYLNKYRGERLWRKAVKNPDDVTDRERERLQKLYRGEVEYTDTQVGNLLDSFRDRELFDDTIVALTSDHGESFGEHGAFSHPHMLYNELTHVPLIVRDPKEEGGPIEAPVELLDLTPTLVEKAGGIIPDGFSGSPLPPSNGEADTSQTVISEADIVPNYTGSVRTERFRYIRNNALDTEELYDIQEDPSEQYNIVEEMPSARDELAATLDEHRSNPQRDVGSKRNVTKTNIEDEGVQSRLQDLGYLE